MGGEMKYKTYLSHHGVKGQKWGVRRYQNSDGSLTSKGKIRYQTESKNPIERHKNNLISKYMAKGYSRDAAEVAAKQRMTTELVVGVVGTVAVSVVAKKAITRIGQDYCDKVIKSGKVIQNINANGKETFKDTPIYAAINRHDKRAYGMLYPDEKRGMARMSLGSAYDGIYKNDLKVTKDVRRASVNNARRILNYKMYTDADFRNETINALTETRYGKDTEKLLWTNPKLFYNRFNQALATPEFQSRGINRKFYTELEKRGYNAILDINDVRYSGFKNKSKNPTIFFGKDLLNKVGSRKLSDVEITDNAVKYFNEFVAKQYATSIAKYASAYGAAKSIRDSRKVEKYLDEHPDSKLSKKEILKMLKEKK